MEFRKTPTQDEMLKWLHDGSLTLTECEPSRLFQECGEIRNKESRQTF